MSYERELAAARTAAAKAASVILDLYRRFDAIADAPASITTAADRESQEVILKALAESYPEDAFRAEEQTPTLARLSSRGRRMWVIDPIDGTRGFARKNGEFSVMIALVRDGEPVVGVVLEPTTGVYTYGAHGEGCWRLREGAEPSAVRVTCVASLAEATLVQSHSDPQRGPTSPVKKLKTRAVTETYSAGIKLARVARGEADLYVSTYDVMNDWDLAAGHILVTEAGGRVTTLDGRPHIYGADSPVHRDGLLASNGALHEAAVEALRG
jgi:3'(2'), 5'-bisphosphate nucleotidase